MWSLANHTPYLAERTWIQDSEGARHWVVVVKATWSILEDGSTKLADEQVDPQHLPVYRGDDGISSLIYEQDLIAGKPGTDVYLNASAYAPRGRATSHVEVSLKVGKRMKTLDVYGERYFKRNLFGRIVASRPARFESLPVIYEYAYGGYDKSHSNPNKHRMFEPNPVGRGHVTRPSSRIDQPAPSVESKRDANRVAAGFGAVCSYWLPRRAFAGTYDDKWLNERKPLLPHDFDPRFHMCAPPDQQFTPHLRGGELVELVNLSPRPLIRFEIPKVYLRFTSAFGSETREHRAKLDTVIIEPDHPRVVTVWHTSLACHHDADYLDECAIDELEYI